MLRLRGRACAALGLLAVQTWCPSSVLAADPAACTKSYENAQVLKKQREYLAARRELLTCMRECPAVVQRECGQWLDALEPVVPSIVVHADVRGEDRSEVKVEMDGKVLAQKLDGKMIEINPGPHQFTFTLDGFPPVKKNLLVHDGEQLRAIRVTFEKPGATVGPSTSAGVSVPTATYILGGIALAGGVGFAVFGLVGNAQRDRLENECSPNCTDPQVDALHRNLVMADVSLGVGLAALAAGAIVWIAQPPGTAAPDRPVVSIAPTQTGATFSATLNFQ